MRERRRGYPVCGAGHHGRGMVVYGVTHCRDCTREAGLLRHELPSPACRQSRSPTHDPRPSEALHWRLTALCIVRWAVVRLVVLLASARMHRLHLSMAPRGDGDTLGRHADAFGGLLTRYAI